MYSYYHCINVALNPDEHPPTHTSYLLNRPLDPIASLMVDRTIRTCDHTHSTTTHCIIRQALTYDTYAIGCSVNGSHCYCNIVVTVKLGMGRPVQMCSQSHWEYFFSRVVSLGNMAFEKYIFSALWSVILNVTSIYYGNHSDLCRLDQPGMNWPQFSWIFMLQWRSNCLMIGNSLSGPIGEIPVPAFSVVEI